MAPGYIETPYDFSDKRWYTQDSDPRTIRTNTPGSIPSRPSSSSATPSFKSYHDHTEYNSPDISVKNLHDAYRSLPSLDYEYKAKPKPKAAAKPKGINRSSELGQRVRAGARLDHANARINSSSSPTMATRRAPGGTASRNRENFAPATSMEDPAPHYEYEVRYHRAHAARVYETVSGARMPGKPRKAPVRLPSHPPTSTLDNHEAYDQQLGASWYHPPPATSTPSFQELNDMPPKESVSWYHPRPEKITTEGPMLRKSKVKVNRVSLVRTSLVVATPMQRQEGGVKTWYAGVRRRLFRKGPKV